MFKRLVASVLNVVLVTLALHVGAVIAVEQNAWLIKSIKVNYIVDANFNQPAESQLTFANGHQAKTSVIDFKLIDLLVFDQGVPFILFSGRECTECDAEKQLYVHAIQDAVYPVLGYPYPGQHFDRESKQLVAETRAFYGQCLTQKAEKTVLFYTRYLDEHQQWQKVLESLQFKGQKVTRVEQKFKQTTVAEIEKLLNSAQCFEIYGL